MIFMYFCRTLLVLLPLGLGFVLVWSMGYFRWPRTFWGWVGFILAGLFASVVCAFSLLFGAALLEVFLVGLRDVEHRP